MLANMEPNHIHHVMISHFDCRSPLYIYCIKDSLRDHFLTCKISIWKTCILHLLNYSENLQQLVNIIFTLRMNYYKSTFFVCFLSLFRLPFLSKQGIKQLISKMVYPEYNGKTLALPGRSLFSPLRCWGNKRMEELTSDDGNTQLT